MQHCTHCGGEVNAAKNGKVTEGKNVYHRECYAVKKHWEKQEQEQVERIKLAREKGF